MADSNKRFNLQFNLEKEEEAFAASILDAMGRKKSALVARAIAFLFEQDRSVIEQVKRYDFSKTEDLIFRGKFMSNAKPSSQPVSPPKEKVNNNKFKKKEKEEPFKEEKVKDIKEPEEPPEDTEALNEMLDALDGFF